MYATHRLIMMYLCAKLFKNILLEKKVTAWTRSDGRTHTPTHTHTHSRTSTQPPVVTAISSLPQAGSTKNATTLHHHLLNAIYTWAEWETAVKLTLSHKLTVHHKVSVMDCEVRQNLLYKGKGPERFVDANSIEVHVGSDRLLKRL